MIRFLSKIKIREKIFYIDKKLSEIRNTRNPHDAETVSPEIIEYWKKHSIKKL